MKCATWGRRRAKLASLVLALFVVAPYSTGDAETFETAARNALLVDFDSGTALLAKNADARIPPASMSKLMTVYMVFDRLREGSLTLEDTMYVSEKAWRMGGSKMFVEVDTEVSVEDLLRGIIVQSGNDACVVVAEAIAGSEENFAELMNQKAAEIGLVGSHFGNATGWPHDDHYMTPRDLVNLTKRIIEEFPEYFRYFAEIDFTYNEIRQGNRNPLLYKDLGVDGMKTGHTEEAGYSLTATGLREGRRLILVVTGLESVRQRSSESERLLNYGFREFNNYSLFDAGETVDAIDVWLGTRQRIEAIIEHDLTVVLPRASRKDLRVSVVANAPLSAPVVGGQQIGRVLVTAPGVEQIERPLLAGDDVARLGPLRRIGAAINYLVFGPSL